MTPFNEVPESDMATASPPAGTASSERDFLLWGTFYLLSHGGILLIPNAIFWDDWNLLYGVEPGTIMEAFRQLGSMFNLAGHLHVALLAIGPWIYKILTFVLMFSSGLFLNLILMRHAAISAEARFFVVLLFLVLPFNLARVALVHFQYTLCYFLFFCAWFLMDRNRIAALALFFLSFITNSFLVFYAVPVLDMLYRSGHLLGPKSAFRFGVRHIDYMLLPFAFFFVKVAFFPPSGDYEGYNQNYALSNLISTPLIQVVDFFKINVRVGLSLLLSLFAFLLLGRRSPTGYFWEPLPRGLWLLGCLIFLLGAFPYWILGHAPIFQDWSSRHQLLLPLGAALIIVSALWALKEPLKLPIVSIVVGVALAFNVAAYAALFVDWQKQSQLIRLFSENAEIESAALVIVDDNTMHLNAMGRVYRHYEWNGLLKSAFGNTKRFGMQRFDIAQYLAGNYNRNLSDEHKAAMAGKDSAPPSVLVRVELLKATAFRERLLSAAFPRFTIQVTSIDLAEEARR